MTDDELYVRGAATLLASWEEYARASAGASLVRLNGVSVAIFPSEPERSVYNNALLDRVLGPAERPVAVDAMEAVYRSAGVDRYAAWVHERDEGMRTELNSRGYTLDEITRAMGMSLDELSLESPEVELETPRLGGVRTARRRPRLAQVRRSERVPHPRGAAGRRERRYRDGLRPRRRLRRVQRGHPRARAPARARHRADGAARPRRRPPGLFDRQPAVHRDGRAGLRRVGFRDLGRILEYAPP